MRVTGVISNDVRIESHKRVASIWAFQFCLTHVVNRRNQRGGPPPRFRNNIFWQILHTFCLLFNLFWTFPVKSIGFLRFQLIFRWCFNDFSGFSAYFQDMFDLSIAEIEWIPHTKGWAPSGCGPFVPRPGLEDRDRPVGGTETWKTWLPWTPHPTNRSKGDNLLHYPCTYTRTLV